MLELLFCFLVLSGVIKASLTLLGFAVIDFTLLALLLYSIYVIQHLVLHRVYLSVDKLIFIGLLFLFYSVNFISFALSEFQDISFVKVIYSLIPLYIVITFLTFEKFDFNRFCKIYIYFSILTSAIFLVFSIRYRLGILDQSMGAENIKTLYLTVGGVISIAILMLIVNKSPFIAFKNQIALLLFIVLFISAARGPLVFLLLCLFLYFLKNLTYYLHQMILNEITSKYLLNLCFKTIVIGTVTSIFINFNPMNLQDVSNIVTGSFDRIMQLFSDDKGDSIGYRVVMLNKTLQSIDHNFFFGVGYGNFGPSVLGEQRYYYPHNMLLEVWAETGIVGLAIVLTLFSYPLLSSRNNFCLSLIVLFLLFNAMKSYSLAENRILFSFVAILVATRAINNKEENYA